MKSYERKEDDSSCKQSTAAAAAFVSFRPELVKLRHAVIVVVVNFYRLDEYDGADNDNDKNAIKVI